MREHTKLVAEGSKIIPFLLAFFGTLICVFVILESYLQMTGNPFSFIGTLNRAGMTAYKVAKEPNHGIWHLVGWIGSACFVLMMFYSFRKRLRIMTDVGSIRYWLDGHMLLGILGTVLVTAHSTYKFGGIVSLSYWSAVLVALSGFVGRYLYVQIPRSISGNELRMEEINDIMLDINAEIEKVSGGDASILHYFDRISGPTDAEERGVISALIAMLWTDFSNMRKTASIWVELRGNSRLPMRVKKRLFTLLREKAQLVRSMQFLSTSHRLLHYWHVFHKPFAVIMFLIMFMHIGVFYLFRV